MEKQNISLNESSNAENDYIESSPFQSSSSKNFPNLNIDDEEIINFTFNTSNSPRIESFTPEMFKYSSFRESPSIERIPSPHICKNGKFYIEEDYKFDPIQNCSMLKIGDTYIILDYYPNPIKIIDKKIIHSSSKGRKCIIEFEFITKKELREMAEKCLEHTSEPSSEDEMQLNISDMEEDEYDLHCWNQRIKKLNFNEYMQDQRKKQDKINKIKKINFLNRVLDDFSIGKDELPNTPVKYNIPDSPWKNFHLNTPKYNFQSIIDEEKELNIHDDLKNNKKSTEELQYNFNPFLIYKQDKLKKERKSRKRPRLISPDSYNHLKLEDGENFKKFLQRFKEENDDSFESSLNQSSEDEKEFDLEPLTPISKSLTEDEKMYQQMRLLQLQEEEENIKERRKLRNQNRRILKWEQRDKMIKDILQKNRESNYKKRTFEMNALCNSFINDTRCKNDDCILAHSLEQLTPVNCSFENNCKYYNDKVKSCQYFHNNETKEQYLERLKLKIEVLPDIVTKNSEYEINNIRAQAFEVIFSEDRNQNEVKIKKSKICNFLTDCKKSECNFAHNIDEFNPINCAFQDTCKWIHTCEYLHPNETKEQLCTRLNLFKMKDNTRQQAFNLLSNANEVKKLVKNNKGSKFCNIFLDKGKCERKHCNFAHSVEEFAPLPCVFKEQCRIKDKKCSFIHPGETIENYLKRNNICLP